MSSTDPPSDSAPDDDRWAHDDQRAGGDRCADDGRWSDESIISDGGGLRQRPQRRPVTPRTDAFSYGDRLVIYEPENADAWITAAVFTDGVRGVDG